MLIPSDLMVLGTRCYHESGVPSCTLLHQGDTFLKRSRIQGLSGRSAAAGEQARTARFGKGSSAGGWEEGRTMQRVVSRHSALKFNQFLAASALSCHGWSSLGFSRSFALQSIDCLVENNARVSGGLPGSNGRFMRACNSSVPRARPAITRRSFRESRKLVTQRSGQRSTSRRIGSTRDLSPQRLLECAVDVLRNFNEKVNSLFQLGGDRGSRDSVSTAVDEKAVTSAVEDNGAPELVGSDVAAELQQQPSREFEWRSALWEAEVSSVEELETASRRGEADVEIRAGEMIAETLPAEITASRPEVESPPENGNVGSTVRNSVPSVEIAETEVELVEETKLDSQADHISQLSGLDAPLGEGGVEIQADDKAEEALTGANRELEHPENVDISIRESSDISSLAPEEPEVSSASVPESVLREPDVETRADEQVDDALTEATTASRQLEHPENGNIATAVQEIAVAEGLPVEEPTVASRSSAISFASDSNASDVPAYALGDVDVEIQADEKIEEAIAADLELEHLQTGEVVSTHNNTSGYSSLAALESSIVKELRPWGAGVVDSETPVTLELDRDGQVVLDDQVGQAVESESSDVLDAQASSSLGDVAPGTIQPSVGDRESDVRTESGDAKSSSEVLVDQSGASETDFGRSSSNADIEAAQLSVPEFERADSNLSYDPEPGAILEHQVPSTSANVQVEVLEPSALGTEEGVDANWYPAKELAEQTPDSELSSNLEPQLVSSSRSVDHKAEESYDAHETTSLDSTRGQEAFSSKGEVVTENGRSFAEKQGEEEIFQNGAPIDGLISPESLSVESGGSEEALESSKLGDEAVAEVPIREQDADAAEVGGERQIQGDLSTRSDPLTAQSIVGMDDLQQESSRLRNSISQHAYLYHTLDRPVISDAAYDSLVKELLSFDSQGSNSEPALNLTVAAEPSPDMLKIVHSMPMLSLASVQKEEEVLAWYSKLQQKKSGLDQKISELVVEPKVDGLALSLRYENGNLKWAATRGNGIQGEDVTHNAQRVLGIPLNIPQNIAGMKSPLTVLEVRGEIYMSLKDFNEWNAAKIQSGEKSMANPRNAAAGSMRLLSSNSSDVRPLSFIAYNIAVIGESVEEDLERSSLAPKSQWEALQFLKSAGFTVNEDNQLFESIDSAVEYAKGWRSTRKGLEYEADGVVLKINDLGAQASLGSAGPDPRWALAWKFAATEAVSVLEGIELTIGRSGAMIPNARFKPVELGGVTISRASLHNFGHVKALGLCEGDRIVVQRAGDVIPQIVQVLEDLRPDTAKPWSPPQECPACGSTLTESSASAMVFCSSSTCPSRHSRQVAYFAKTLISGLGSANLSRLEEELVKDPADFYALDEKSLSKVKGFGKQSAKKLLKAIEDSKQQKCYLFIAALGIPRVGLMTAKELGERFCTLEELLNADLTDLQDVPGVGAGTAQCIFDWCQSEVNIDLVHRLELAGCKVNGNRAIKTQEVSYIEEDSFVNVPSPAQTSGLTNESEGEPEANENFKEGSQRNVSAIETDVVEDLEEIEINESEDTSDDLKSSDEALVDVTSQPTVPALFGKAVVVTGEFGDVKREDLKKLVTLHCGVVRTSVTSRTSFLVAGNRPGPTKVAEALRRGIDVLDLQSFLKLIGATESDVV